MQPDYITNYLKTHRTKIIILTGAILVLGLLFWLLPGGKSIDNIVIGEKRGVAGEPLDVATDFYGAWIAAKESTTTDPYATGLQNSVTLGVAASKRLADAESDFRENSNDLVLCQSGIPDKLRTKPIFKTENKVGIMLLPSKGEGTAVSVATLELHDELWSITDITCTLGEQGPDQGEFTFDKEGWLLHNSVQPPLDPKYWYLVFEQSGVLGYTAPLFLSDSSVCALKGDSEETCREDMFSESLHVQVQGGMTEAGVEVKRIEVLE